MKQPSSPQHNLKFDIIGILLVGLAALCFLAGFSKLGGVAGYYLYKGLRIVLGEVWWATPVAMGYMGITMITARRKPDVSHRGLGVILLAALIAGAIHQRLPENSYFINAIRGLGGGLIGSAMFYLIYGIFGTLGGHVLSITLGLIAISLTSNTSVVSLFQKAAVLLRRGSATIRTSLVDFVTDSDDEESVQPDDELAGLAMEPQCPENGIASALRRKESQPQTGRTKRTQKALPEEDDSKDQISLNVGADSSHSYRLPPISLLEGASGKTRSGKAEKDIAAKAKVLEQTLGSFGVNAKVVEINRGPTVTRFELQPATGVKVSSIVSLANDIALNLAAPDVRIEAPVPGKSVVGIEVPNKEISIVHLRDIIDTTQFGEQSSKLTVAFGKDISGRPVIQSLEKMPHLLIAGATGSGKSVCINCIICSLLFKARPDEVKLLLIDPKMVELSAYDGIPHLITKVVTDPRKAAGILRWAVKEMERRYQLFVETGVRDIGKYNSNKMQEAQPDKVLPYIVVVIDELADLMSIAPVEVEDAIFRLAQMARAAGLHLVVATQRPSVDVITGTIKANIPSRIAFAVSSQVDSRTILDAAGAEKLLGKGDMLFLPVGFNKPIRAQGAYISEIEVEALVKYVSAQGEPSFEQNIEIEYEAKDDTFSHEEDSLFTDAVRIVVEAGQASVSLLQRKLPIGYARAARLVDAMEERGFIGAYEGSKPREVKLTFSEYERLFRDRN